MSHSRQKKRSAKLWWTSLLLIGSLSALAFGRNKNQGNATGCCSRHGGVCDCACCDGSPLSRTCQKKLPRCGSHAQTAELQQPPFQLTGQVVYVADGDTIGLKTEKGTHRIRLADIDCPESNQSFGQEAKAFATTFILHKQATAHVRARDRYGRDVADVFGPDGQSLNQALLKAGLAWWYRHYSNDPMLGALEKEARAHKRGLWQQADPLPPWVFRRNKRHRP